MFFVRRKVSFQLGRSYLDFAIMLDFLAVPAQNIGVIRVKKVLQRSGEPAR